MFLRDIDDRTDEHALQMANLLEKEFQIFKELTLETSHEVKVVERLAK